MRSMSSGGPGVRRRVGILGGSFNPAHDGHRQISLSALAALDLDEVWWLVAPQNPLKSTQDMAPFAERMAQAIAVARHPQIRISDLEARLGTRYTADTLAMLRRRFPGYRFVWLMGADNLAQIATWRDWRRIFALQPIAIFDRPTYTYKALAAKAARCFARYRLPERAGRLLAGAVPPAWIFIHERLNPISATAIRNRRSAVRLVGKAANGKPAGRLAGN